jgi:hypothetical protein
LIWHTTEERKAIDLKKGGLIVLRESNVKKEKSHFGIILDENGKKYNVPVD